MTRILSRTDLISLLDPAACVKALREGFRQSREATVPGLRVRTDLPFPGTATALLPGLLPGIDAYTVKVNAKFPAARPALRGVICLHSGQDGELLALLDSATITAWRTGLAAALGTHELAAEPEGGTVLGIIGAGAQAEQVLTGLRLLRHVAGLVVHDIDPARAHAFATRHGGQAVDSPSAVAARADTVVLATWSRTPLLSLDATRPGQHFTTLGVDEPGKQELAGDLLADSLLVVDDRDLAGTSGVLTGTPLTATTLGEILRGTRPGRTTPTQRTVYAPVGLPWQDLALSWLAHQEAEHHTIGLHVDFLADPSTSDATTR